MFFSGSVVFQFIFFSHSIKTHEIRILRACIDQVERRFKQNIK